MVRQLSRARRRERFLQQAMEMFEELETWYDQHPAATFGEIEQEARQQRRKFAGKALEILINGRDTGFEWAPPLCPQCEQEMVFQGYREKTIRGLEGRTRLERAYYVCPQGCGETFFPPGPEAETAQGPLE